VNTILQAGPFIRALRHEAKLTQRQLATRIGTTQSAIAALERPDSNPTVRTLADALDALGYRLKLDATLKPNGVDESLIRKQLELTPAQRLESLEQMAGAARQLVIAGAKSRGELG
jgi:transcriptional regulator with XRE-family HTH domain